MSEFSSLFEGLYNRFILRDLFAKIVPGFIVFISTVSVVLGSFDSAIEYVSGLSFWPWLFIFSLSWTLGFLAQETGGMLGILRDSYKDQTAKGGEKSIVSYYKDNIKIYIEANDNFQKALERIVVIKEACGNVAIALSYATILFVINHSLGFHSHRNPHYRFHGLTSSTGLVIILSIFAVYVLIRAHREQMNRQQVFRKAYFEYLRDRSLAKNAPEDSTTIESK